MAFDNQKIFSQIINPYYFLPFFREISISNLIVFHLQSNHLPASSPFAPTPGRLFTLVWPSIRSDVSIVFVFSGAAIRARRHFLCWIQYLTKTSTCLQEMSLEEAIGYVASDELIKGDRSLASSLFLISQPKNNPKASLFTSQQDSNSIGYGC
ncbi:uncharacterized protein LOC116404420 [Cucumis sativus]|uniref:uncharacterized protein LOC116404420 n=1 Tax=Cucumis sativus TaxID=3659 RepID=UPI0012F4D781|nr:uncharacterized protein LOC116404420 [Cucumis sativus]